jgi:DNA-binding MarR family transcriptional regulator
MNNPALQTAPERELFLDDFIPCRLSNRSQSVSRSIATIYGARFGLTTAEWRVVVVLGRFPGLSAVEVAERTQLDKVAVSRAVAKLLKSGRIDRRFADVDRRRSILNLSDSGRELLAEIAPMALDFEDRLLGELTDAEVAVFNRVIDKLFVKSHWMDDTP